jgi:chromosome segregation ATPase
MTDPNADTADLTDREILQAILRRLDALEARADDRARETRPLLDQIIKETVTTRETLSERMDGIEARLDAIERESKTIRREMGLLREDIRGERLHRAELAERIEDLERRPN